MKSVNKIHLIGAVGKDPELRYTPAGVAIASFSLATNRKTKDKQNVVQWHTLVAFGKTAELVQEYVKKGSKLYVEGELQYNTYEKDGIKRTVAKIHVLDMSFLSASSKESNNAGDYQEQKISNQFLEDDIPF